jgi:hypothetical protein
VSGTESDDSASLTFDEMKTEQPETENNAATTAKNTPKRLEKYFFTPTSCFFTPETYQTAMGKFVDSRMIRLENKGESLNETRRDLFHACIVTRELGKRNPSYRKTTKRLQLRKMKIPLNHPVLALATSSP